MPIMSWDEWARHDAVALAGLVRGGQATPTEPARQAADGVARLTGSGASHRCT